MEDTRNMEARGAAAQDCCAPAANSGSPNSRKLLIGAAVAGIGAALFFGWEWLVAAGVASILIALAPCLVMCALGLCASRMGKGSGTAPPPGAGTTPVSRVEAEPAAGPEAHTRGDRT